MSNVCVVSPVEVVVKNTLDTRRVFNVLATLKGSTEPGQCTDHRSLYVCVFGGEAGGDGRYGRGMKMNVISSGN